MIMGDVVLRRGLAARPQPGEPVVRCREVRRPARAKPTAARTAPAPSATALRVFSKNQMGSYIAGKGPNAGIST